MVRTDVSRCEIGMTLAGNRRALKSAFRRPEPANGWARIWPVVLMH